MRITRFLFLTAIALSFGAGKLSAQGLTPSYAPSASYYAADASLESRMSMLEDAMKKKVDKVDTKKAFDYKVTGRVFLESLNFGDPDVKNGDISGQRNISDQGNIFGFRETQVDVSGTGFEIFDYRIEVGYNGAGGTTSFRDVCMGVKNVPGCDYVRIGHYKVETGFAHTTSGLSTTAMETPTSSQAFSIGRRVGIGQTYYFAKDQVRWFNGVFGSEDLNTSKFTAAGTSAGGAVYNSRLTFVPYYELEGARYFHFGGHYMYRERQTSATVFSAPGVKIGGFNRANNWFVPAAEVLDYNQGGLEISWGHGPLAITSELFAGTFGKGRDMFGGYIEARYFLTGDTRLYNKRSGTPGAVKLKKNFLTMEECVQTCCGPAKGFGFKSWGAWELYAQWVFTDSERIARISGVGGGRTTDTVLGLNWYWNPNTRMMFEYVHSDGTNVIADYRATEDIFGIGFRFHF